MLAVIVKTRTVKALLLAGGYGTRLQPLTDTIPKCLLELDGKRLIDYWVLKLIDAGVKQAIVNTHHLREVVRKYIETVNSQNKIDLIESYEPELLGSAGTVSNNASFADNCEMVLLIYADNLSSIDLGKLIDFHRSHSEPVTMLLFHAENPKACGIATLDKNGLIINFVEKPAIPDSDLANAGVYVVDSDVYRDIADMNAFDFGFDVLPHYVGKMKGYVFNGYHRDIGTIASLERARQDIQSGLYQSFVKDNAVRPCD